MNSSESFKTPEVRSRGPRLCHPLTVKFYREIMNHTLLELWHDDEKVAVLQYILNGYVLTGITVIGVISNLISLAIFLRKPAPNNPRKHTTVGAGSRIKLKRPIVHQYLAGMTVWETLLLFPASFCLFSYPTLRYGQMVFLGDYSVVIPLAYCLSSGAMVASNWIMLTLSVDRYMALCAPLVHFRLKLGQNSYNKHLIIILAISCLAMLYAIPEYYVLGVIRCRVPTGDLSNQSMLIDQIPTVSSVNQVDDISYILPTSFSETVAYRVFYRTIGGILFYSAVPFTVILVLTIVIRNRYKSMESSSQKKSKFETESQSTALEGGLLLRCNTSKSHEVKMQINSQGIDPKSRHSNAKISTNYDGNYMFLVFAMKFVMTRGLCAALDVLDKLMPTLFQSENGAIRTLIHMSNFLVLLGSATNFFVYWYYSTRFKAALTGKSGFWRRSVNNRDAKSQIDQGPVRSRAVVSVSNPQVLPCIKKPMNNLHVSGCNSPRTGFNNRQLSYTMSGLCEHNQLVTKQATMKHADGDSNREIDSTTYSLLFPHSQARKRVRTLAMGDLQRMRSKVRFDSGRSSPSRMFRMKLDRKEIEKQTTVITIENNGEAGCSTAQTSNQTAVRMLL